jgi:class 3 adenylate cyclase
MSGYVHVRFCERLGVKFPRATHLVQSTGDGIFVLFGAPLAHEDHPQRALYAALRMQEDLRRYSDRPRVEGKLPLQARVGVNTGEVVVRSCCVKVWLCR